MIQIWRTFPLFLILALGSGIAVCQQRIVAPIERSGYEHATSYDSLQAFLNTLGATKGIQVERVAVSPHGRKISAVKISADSAFGTNPSKLRMLIFAQQHGDEPSGKEALTLLIAKFASGQNSRWTENMDILIVPQMNPDGAELHQRRTSDSIDLNRNHVLLTSPETKGLHNLFNRWMPEVTVDIHEYTSGKEWYDSGMVKTGDVQLGMLTHPSTPDRIRQLQHQNIFPFVAARMEQKGYRFQEYIVGSPDTRIRHSTTEINDGRESFGILNSLSFIQEGRKWYGLDDTLRRRAGAQLTSVEALIDYCSMYAGEIRALVSSERLNLPKLAGTNVVLRLEHVSSVAQMKIPVFNLRLNKDTVWSVTPYHSVVQPHLSVKIPSAYIVPKQLTAVLDLLRRHHITMEKITSRHSIHTEVFTIDSVGTEYVEEDPKPQPFGHWKKATSMLHEGDMIVRTGQLQSVLITIILEPESVWGLMGYSVFESLLKKTGAYSIVRVVP